MDNNYWKKKYADIHSRLTSKIAELAKENAELKAENDRLKEEVKEVKKYQYEQEYLDKEIEEMQKTLKTLAEGLNKRQMLLQEIKAIAERCNLCEECSGIDDCERECCDAAEPCSTYQMQIILNKITKAEEE